MTEQRFWNLFAETQQEVGDLAAYADEAGMEALQAKLEALPPEEIVDFERIFTQKYFDAYRWDLWAAAYIIGGGCSDDGFIDFRSELISRGKDVYESVLRDPECIADHPEPVVFGAEGWQYLAGKAYETVTGKNLPDIGVPYPKEPTGTRWTDEELPKLFPKLWERFGS